jgi:signal transduction histidine kinase
MRDNGCGIEPQFLTRSSDLFVQGRQSLAQTQGGLGIGPTLVQRLVELYGAWSTPPATGPAGGAS